MVDKKTLLGFIKANGVKLPQSDTDERLARATYVVREMVNVNGEFFEAYVDIYPRCVEFINAAGHLQHRFFYDEITLLENEDRVFYGVIGA